MFHLFSRGTLTFNRWDTGPYRWKVGHIIRIMNYWNSRDNLSTAEIQACRKQERFSSYCWGRPDSSCTAGFSWTFQAIPASVLPYSNGALHRNFQHMGCGHLWSSGHWDNCWLSKSILYIISTMLVAKCGCYALIWQGAQHHKAFCSLLPKWDKRTGNKTELMEAKVSLIGN